MQNKLEIVFTLKCSQNTEMSPVCLSVKDIKIVGVNEKSVYNGKQQECKWTKTTIFTYVHVELLHPSIYWI